MKRLIYAVAIALTVMGISSDATAASSLRLARYTNIPDNDYFPSSDTITRERALIAAMRPASVSEIIVPASGFSTNLNLFEAAIYSGKINIDQSGTYTFAVRGDDAARISIDGRAIVEATFHNYPTIRLPSTASLYLAAGSYDFEAFTYQLTGNQWFTTSVTGGPTAVSFSAAAVPEPATWAMMLVGFAMVASAGRYRRRATSVAFA
ncbi:PEPxxWA-CTERM sorting domain-containing protein [Sphingomonas abaci]|uniref:PA14 domain-containing protein n=1 Tax=Sphingomonas abaci TaxID=237611 RepID=A0A7W7AMH8_9SPHN|nr:PEPxxWA-CTERM sorting domain-containing protein [Sphingomonas abaci]MBB4618732.1 hypothetical protein [Sphingomonas abaci]